MILPDITEVKKILNDALERIEQLGVEESDRAALVLQASVTVRDMLLNQIKVIRLVVEHGKEFTPEIAGLLGEGNVERWIEDPEAAMCEARELAESTKELNDVIAEMKKQIGVTEQDS